MSVAPGRTELGLVREHLMGFQDRVCAALEAVEAESAGQACRFDARELPGERGGVSRPRVLSGGQVVEKAGVHFSHALGSALPAAATERRPELAGRRFEAVSTSLIVHPRNPYAPTTHANFRFFIAEREGAAPVWWFGGGFDLTPIYGFDEDCREWHGKAREACADEATYRRLKARCDEYFFLPHRDETRGIGGLFFDDWSEGGFAAAFAFVQRASAAFLEAYVPILRRRLGAKFGERERAHQLIRRGRYVEFNLLYDRGTRYGLQSGGRVESILASLPPLVRWDYDVVPEPDSPEALLRERYLVPRDWLGGN